MQKKTPLLRTKGKQKKSFTLSSLLGVAVGLFVMLALGLGVYAALNVKTDNRPGASGKQCKTSKSDTACIGKREGDNTADGKSVCTRTQVYGDLVGCKAVLGTCKENRVPVMNPGSAVPECLLPCQYDTNPGLQCYIAAEHTQPNGSGSCASGYTNKKLFCCPKGHVINTNTNTCVPWKDPAPTPAVPTISATTRGNYCVGFTATTSSSNPSLLNPGNTVSLTSWANALGNKFWYIAYNRDNLNAPNDPKPVCVTSGGDVTTVKGSCPGTSYQLIFLNPSNELRQNSGTMSKTWEQVFLPDANWNGKRVAHLQLNAHFSVTGGVFSLPNPTCVKTLDSGYTP